MAWDGLGLGSAVFVCVTMCDGLCDGLRDGLDVASLRLVELAFPAAAPAEVGNFGASSQCASRIVSRDVSRCII